MTRLDYISFLHKQNLNGRETEDELFELGIKCALEEVEEWIEKRVKELFDAKTKFKKNNCNDWIEIPDYKISELNNFKKKFIEETES
jgi:Na+/phosphate symporter